MAIAYSSLHKVWSSGASPATTDEKEPKKVSVKQVRGLSLADWEFIQKKQPDLAMKMLRLRFSWHNMRTPSPWLDANCKGFFFIPHGAGGGLSNCVLFEEEDDAVLFKMHFEGK